MRSTTQTYRKSVRPTFVHVWHVPTVPNLDLVFILCDSCNSKNLGTVTSNRTLSCRCKRMCCQGPTPEPLVQAVGCQAFLVHVQSLGNSCARHSYELGHHQKEYRLVICHYGNTLTYSICGCCSKGNIRASRVTKCVRWEVRLVS